MSKFNFKITKLDELFYYEGEYHNDLSFLERDVIGAMEQMKEHCKMYGMITTFDGTQEEKSIMIKQAVDGFEKIGEMPIITAAYISTEEFKPGKWRMPGEPVPCSDMLSLPEIPVDEVLDRESKMLEELGFLNINNYVKYESKVAFIYGNSTGKRIKEYLDGLINDFNHKKEEE